jgi:hypothetical protein
MKVTRFKMIARLKKWTSLLVFRMRRKKSKIRMKDKLFRKNCSRKRGRRRSQQILYARIEGPKLSKMPVRLSTQILELQTTSRLHVLMVST